MYIYVYICMYMYYVIMFNISLSSYNPLIEFYLFI